MLCLPAHAASKKNPVKPSTPRFEILFPKEVNATPLDGHVLLVLANNNDTEPRFQISFMTAQSQQIFGADVDALAPGTPAVIDTSTLGYPAESLNDVPAGDYWVQAVLNIYDTFHLGNGRTLKLPPDKGEGQHWQTKPNNLFSKPEKIHFDPKSPRSVTIRLILRNPTLDLDPTVVDKMAGWSGANDEHKIVDNQVGDAHPYSERSVDQILGTTNVSWRGDSASGWMGAASRRPLSGDRCAGPLPPGSSRNGCVSHYSTK